MASSLNLKCRLMIECLNIDESQRVVGWKSAAIIKLNHMCPTHHPCAPIALDLHPTPLCLTFPAKMADDAPAREDVLKLLKLKTIVKVSATAASLHSFMVCVQKHLLETKLTPRRFCRSTMARLSALSSSTT